MDTAAKNTTKEYTQQVEVTRTYGPELNPTAIPYWFLYAIFALVMFVGGQLLIRWIDRIWNRRERRDRDVNRPNTYTIDDRTVEKILEAFSMHNKAMQRIFDSIEESREEQRLQNEMLRTHIEVENKTLEVIGKLSRKLEGGITT